MNLAKTALGVSTIALLTAITYLAYTIAWPRFTYAKVTQPAWENCEELTIFGQLGWEIVSLHHYEDYAFHIPTGSSTECITSSHAKYASLYQQFLSSRSQNGPDFGYRKTQLIDITLKRRVGPFHKTTPDDIRNATHLN